MWTSTALAGFQRKEGFMSDRRLLLGIDIGTSGCKVTVIDTDCNFIGDGYTEYTTYHPNIGWSEQDPADWFPAFMRSFRIALEKGKVSAEQVVALSLDEIGRAHV